jgi:hypothetical protein
MKERDREGALEASERSADRRLGEMEFCRGDGDAARAGDGDEDREIVQARRHRSLFGTI